ncbi:hypothetical protein AL755_03885 (plasmid) [Arthrobacter sp. ERGS1:01]|nr:hypothetical protein AL755_03885 [Arthrobacter sp. ERGS1:01]
MGSDRVDTLTLYLADLSKLWSVFVLVLVALAVLAALLMLPITYIKAPSRILKRIEGETCHHFIASKYLPADSTSGEALVSLAVQPAHFTSSGCWPHPALYLYLGHKDRGSKLNGRLGDRNDRGAPQTLVSIRGSDLLAGIDRGKIRWRRRDDALALIGSGYRGPAHLIHGVDHTEVRSQRASPFDFH